MTPFYINLYIMTTFQISKVSVILILQIRKQTQRDVTERWICPSLELTSSKALRGARNCVYMDIRFINFPRYILIATD